MTSSATMFRPPLIDSPFQGMTLMQSPPMLYRTAAKNTNSTPSFPLFSVVRCVKNTPVPLGQRAMNAGTTSVRPLSRKSGLRKSETYTLYRAHPSSPTQRSAVQGASSKVLFARKASPPFSRPGSLWSGKALLLFLFHALSAS